MTLNQREQTDLRVFLQRVYGPQAKHWSMTPGVFDLVHGLLSQSSECARLLQHEHVVLAPGQVPSRWLSAHTVAMTVRELGRCPGSYAQAVKPAADGMRIAFYRTARA